MCCLTIDSTSKNTNFIRIKCTSSCLYFSIMFINILVYVFDFIQQLWKIVNYILLCRQNWINCIFPQFAQFDTTGKIVLKQICHGKQHLLRQVCCDVWDSFTTKISTTRKFFFDLVATTGKVIFDDNGLNLKHTHKLLYLCKTICHYIFLIQLLVGKFSSAM